MVVEEFFKTLRFIINHPLNAHDRFNSILRYFRWQISTRILNFPVLVPLIEDVDVIAHHGMTGVTGNYYCGLDEYEDMSLVLHLLRRDDWFIDIGSNEGVYSLLAAGGPKCNVISVEPVPDIYHRLKRNINTNGLDNRIRAMNVCLGLQKGEMRFSANDDTKDHVLLDTEECNDSVIVEMCRLDDILCDVSPVMLKIDVEGYEYFVLQGGENTLDDKSLIAVIIETNGSGSHYGYGNSDIFALFRKKGFSPYRYSPQKRIFFPLNESDPIRFNTIFLRDIELVKERVSTGGRYRLGNGCVI
jgi:FkbM family methyltransferase